jgi:hypothetical protein
MKTNRSYWPAFAGWTLLASIVLGGAGLILLSVERHRVLTRNHDVFERVNENRLWDMLAGDRPLGRGPVGHIARIVKPAIDADEQVRAMVKVYIKADEFPAANDIIHMQLIDSIDDSSGVDTNNGYLTPEFILAAIQASEHPTRFHVAVPPRRDMSLWEWRNVAVPFLLPWLVLPFLYLGSIVYQAHERRERAAEKREYLASLSSEAREIYRIREKLVDMRGDGVMEARRQADAAFALATQGWLDTEKKAELADLMKDLGILTEAVAEGQRTYKEGS